MVQKVRALVKAKADRGLWMEDVPMPTIGPNDALIKVEKSAICGTDLHIYTWDAWAEKTIPVPMVVGHEFVGEVVEVGSQVSSVAAGERVSGEGHVTCGACRNCRAGKRHLCRKTLGVGVNRTGSFCEYLSIPAENVFPIPDAIDSEVASIFDPYGNAVHTALSFDLVGEDVLITGAGPIGCMAAAICKHVGARNIVVTDVIPYRLELAGKLGATHVVNPKDESLQEVMKTLGMKEGFDVGLEMSGSGEAYRSMVAAMNHGGKIALLGIFPNEVSLDWDEVIFKGLFIKGIYGREMYETWYKAASMIESGLDISPVITHKISIDDYESGFEMMESRQCGKVIMDW